MWNHQKHTNTPAIPLKDVIRKKAAEATTRKEPHLPHQYHDLIPDELVEHEQEPPAENKISRGDEDSLILEESHLPEVYHQAEPPAIMPPEDELLPAAYDKNAPGPLAFFNSIDRENIENRGNETEPPKQENFSHSFRGRLKKMIKKLKSNKK